MEVCKYNELYLLALLRDHVSITQKIIFQLHVTNSDIFTKSLKLKSFSEHAHDLKLQYKIQDINMLKAGESPLDNLLHSELSHHRCQLSHHRCQRGLGSSTVLVKV